MIVICKDVATLSIISESDVKLMYWADQVIIMLLSALDRQFLID